MMDCRQVNRLLPLWVGQDLPDAATANEISAHLKGCRDCEHRRLELQTSLEVLQGLSGETLATEPTRHSVWPKLMIRISDWNDQRRRERFNGWIPASVMGLAVILMIAVSIPSIQDAFSGGAGHSENVADLFLSDPGFRSDAGPNANQAENPAHHPQRGAQGTPVNFKPDQW